MLLKSMLPRSRPMGGIRTSLTKELTMPPKAAPMMMPTAMSTTLPFMANSLNSLNILPPRRRILRPMPRAEGRRLFAEDRFQEICDPGSRVCPDLLFLLADHVEKAVQGLGGHIVVKIDRFRLGEGNRRCVLPDHLLVRPRRPHLVHAGR